MTDKAVDQPRFSVDTHYNEYVPRENTSIDAIVSITHRQPDGEEALNKKAVIFTIDVSGSMDGESKIDSAINAVTKCIRELPEDTMFAVIKFASEATLVFPSEEAWLLPATDENKDDAITSISKLRADGGTEMSKALYLGRKVFNSFDGIKVMIFLTDGDNNSDDRDKLERALKELTGEFQCYPRGVGTDWTPRELMKISSALLGETKAIANANMIAQDFRDTLEEAMSKRVANVNLKLWTPINSDIEFVKQVYPLENDLSQMVQKNGQWRSYPLGAFADEETRELHIRVKIPPEENASELRLARVGFCWTQDGSAMEVAGPAIVVAWSEDESMTARINSQVAHYTGQAELKENIEEGLQALNNDDFETATKRLGKAIKLAKESGNNAALTSLNNVVEVDQDGTVRLKAGASNKFNRMELETSSVRTARLNQSSNIN